MTTKSGYVEGIHGNGTVAKIRLTVTDSGYYQIGKRALKNLTKKLGCKNNLNALRVPSVAGALDDENFTAFTTVA